MSNEVIKKYMLGEFESLYNDLDKSVAQLILLRRFFRDLVLLSKGESSTADVSPTQQVSVYKQIL